MVKTNAAHATEFAHMLLRVADVVNRSERFYVGLLGFTVRTAKPLPDGRPFVPFHQGLALTSGDRARRCKSTISPSRRKTCAP